MALIPLFAKTETSRVDTRRRHKQNNISLSHTWLNVLCRNVIDVQREIIGSAAISVYHILALQIYE